MPANPPVHVNVTLPAEYALDNTSAVGGAYTVVVPLVVPATFEALTSTDHVYGAEEGAVKPENVTDGGVPVGVTTLRLPPLGVTAYE